MRIGVFGGSFDPPHIGHRIVAKQAIEQLGLDELIFMPTKESEFKKPAASPFDRIAMLSISLPNDCDVSIREAYSEEEFTRTIDTVRGLVLKYPKPEHELWFIYGADSWNDLINWEEPEEILQAVKIAVVPREGIDIRPQPDAIIEGPHFMGLSSTFIRERIKDQKDVEDYLHPKVLEYIKRKKIYF